MNKWRFHLVILAFLLLPFRPLHAAAQRPFHGQTTSAIPDDEFDSASLDSAKWLNKSVSGGRVEQNGELLLSTAVETPGSAAQVYTQYMLLGDFDIQVDFRLENGWSPPIEDVGLLLIAGLSVWLDDANYLFLQRLKGSGFEGAAVYSSLLGKQLAFIPAQPTTGRLRIVRSDASMSFLLDAGQGWEQIYSGQGFQAPAYVQLSAMSVGIARSFTSAFDNFRINSGESSYRPLIWSDLYPSRRDFQIGAHCCDYLAHHIWGSVWKQCTPFKELSANGLKWARAWVTTVSSKYLRDTPTEHWNQLPWRNEYWSSLEYTTEILKEAARYGQRLSVVLFMSNEPTGAGKQGSSPEWEGLSVSETAAAVEEYTYNTARYFKDQGLNIEVYELGNEVDFGILRFLAGDRIPLPPGVNPNDTQWMRQNVWSIEATLLKAAIRGVKRANPDAKIVIHISGVLAVLPGSWFAKAFFRAMVDEGVEFDYAGLSLPYPLVMNWGPPAYTTIAWYQVLQELVDYIAGLNKKVILSEGNYPGAPDGIVGPPMKGYPYTREGQRDWVHDLLRFAANNPNIAGFYYWYPDHIPGMGNDPESLPLQSEGLFLTEAEPAPAMLEFRVNSSEDRSELRRRRRGPRP